jgi:hypothetical protein
MERLNKRLQSFGYSELLRLKFENKTIVYLKEHGVLKSTG